MIRSGMAIFAALACIGLGGCDASPSAKIGEVSQQAAAFDGKEVKLRGTASQATKIPLVDAKVYRLKDATGEIVVWAATDLPKEGEEVVVKGKVESVAIVAGQGFGLAVREIERKPAGIRWPWQ